MVRGLTGKRVSPVHRLDRGTGGVLLFAFHSEAEKSLNKQFQDKKIYKRYHAIVRGYTKEEKGIIDKALQKEGTNKFQEALTHYQTLSKTVLPVKITKYPTSRYSFVELRPETGRTHQLRRHLNHISCPIIGDHRHGDYRHNHYFRDTLGYHHLHLHASLLRFEHPSNGKKVTINAPLHANFKQTMEYLNLTF